MNNINIINKIQIAELPGIIAHKEMSFTNRNFDKPDDAIKSAVMILLFEQNNELYFPLIKRPEYLKHHKGQMALPGGKLNANEDIYQCAIREGYEELGIIKENVSIIKQLTELYIPVSKHLVFPLICFYNHTSVSFQTNDEVEKIIVCSMQDLLHFQKQTAKVKITDERMMEAPAFIYKEEVIWGATALILNEFREMLLKLSVF